MKNWPAQAELGRGTLVPSRVKGFAIGGATRPADSTKLLHGRCDPGVYSWTERARSKMLVEIVRYSITARCNDAAKENSGASSPSETAAAKKALSLRL